MSIKRLKITLKIPLATAATVKRNSDDCKKNTGQANRDDSVPGDARQRLGTL